MYPYLKQEQFIDLVSICTSGKDVCFYTKAGHEVLLLADTSNDCILMLDHNQGCKVIGQTILMRPISMAKDDKGRLWVACGSDKVANETKVYMFSN